MQVIHERKLMVFFAIGILLLGCKERTSKEVESAYENGKPKTVKYYKGEGQTRTIVKEIQYFSNGEIKVEGEYEDGKKDGQWIFYYESGTKWSQGSFKQGLPTGKTMVYHENGQLFYEGEYLEGQKHGNWNFYNEEGGFVNKIQFEAGILVSRPNKDEHIKDTSLVE